MLLRNVEGCSLPLGRAPYGPVPAGLPRPVVRRGRGRSRRVERLRAGPRQGVPKNVGEQRNRGPPVLLVLGRGLGLWLARPRPPPPSPPLRPAPCPSLLSSLPPPVTSLPVPVRAPARPGRRLPRRGRRQGSARERAATVRDASRPGGGPAGRASGRASPGLSVRVVRAPRRSPLPRPRARGGDPRRLSRAVPAPRSVAEEGRPAPRFVDRG